MTSKLCNCLQDSKGRGVVSLSKTLHTHCLVLVKAREWSQNDRNIVDRDIKPQRNKQTKHLDSKENCFFLHLSQEADGMK